MMSLRLAALLGAGLLPASPALAFSELVEREPARGALLLGVVFVVALSWVMACRRWWLPLVAWLPLCLAASAFVAHLIDPAVSAAIRDEIGFDYLMETDLFVAVALVAPLMIAHTRLGRREASRREWWRH